MTTKRVSRSEKKRKLFEKVCRSCDGHFVAQDDSINTCDPCRAKPKPPPFRAPAVTILAAPNSCVNCKYEETCGYSPAASRIGGNQRNERSYGPCPLGNKSDHGKRPGKPFFQAKGTELVPDEEFQLEARHRTGALLIDWNHVVQLPNGEFDRVNRFDYNLATAAKSDQYIQLASTAWIQINKLRLIPEASR